MSTNYDQPDDTYAPADDEDTIARIEAYEAACIDGEITAEDMTPEEGDDA